jgi:hypothetical protein
MASSNELKAADTPLGVPTGGRGAAGVVCGSAAVGVLAVDFGVAAALGVAVGLATTVRWRVFVLVVDELVFWAIPNTAVVRMESMMTHNLFSMC